MRDAWVSVVLFPHGTELCVAWKLLYKLLLAKLPIKLEPGNFFETLAISGLNECSLPVQAAALAAAVAAVNVGSPGKLPAGALPMCAHVYKCSMSPLQPVNLTCEIGADPPHTYGVMAYRRLDGLIRVHQSCTVSTQGRASARDPTCLSRERG